MSTPREMVGLERVCRTYPGGVVALRDVDLTIAAGELVAITGPSGSGKSTMLQLIGTLDRPTSGRATVAGHDIATLSDAEVSALRAKHIGFVFQQFHLNPGVPVLESVADGLLYAGVARRERRTRAARALADVGLGGRVDHLPNQLSGGERQRVAIARALIGGPALILADEPTGNLDSASGKAVLDLLRGSNERGATVVVITHDHEIAASLPRRIGMRDGVLLSDSRELA